jgi:hypothetical protein
VLAAYGAQSDTYQCPAPYALIQKAKYLNCKPWELLEQSVYWQDWAAISMTAEHDARKILHPD